jgi:hypothetical protein
MIAFTNILVESKYSSDRLNDKGSLSLIKYTHQVDNIFNYEWSNFQKVEEFGSYIINSNLFPITEYIYRWGDDLQNIPRIRSFTRDCKKKPNESYSKPKSQLISAIARPLLLITQKSFWTGLMESYFKFLHPSCTLFSLVNFEPSTTPESLLSAIYYAGFIIQPNRPNEIGTYMHAYAITNIKKILLSVKISSSQALGLYSYALYINGNSSLSRVCLSHFARMNHALGIGVSRKNLSIIDQYNRKLIYRNVRLYYVWAKLGPSSYKVVYDENEDKDLDIYEPKFQIPNSSLNLYNNEYLSTLYSVFCTQFAKLSNFNIAVNSTFCNHESKNTKQEIELLNIRANEIYNDAKVTMESLINLAPKYKSQTSIQLNLIKAPYIGCILCIYTKMLEISKSCDFSITKVILDNCIELWNLISSNKIFISKWSWAPYLVGFHLIKAYPHCSKTQKKSALFILKSIIQLFYKEGYNLNTMNFIILKTQFDLININ